MTRKIETATESSYRKDEEINFLKNEIKSLVRKEEELRIEIIKNLKAEEMICSLVDKIDTRGWVIGALLCVILALGLVINLR